MIRQFFRQAWTMMKQHRLFTGMYLVGTAVSIALAMTLFIIFYIKLGPIYPEYNRDRTVSMSLVYCQGEGENKTRMYGLASPIFLQKKRKSQQRLLF